MTDVFQTTTSGKDGSVFADLVGEGKKFKDPESLAKGKVESDAFIQKLQDENKGLVEELEALKKNGDKSATTQNLIEEIRKSLAVNKDGAKEQPSLDDETLTKKIREAIKGETAEQTRSRNREQGNSLVLQKVGGDVEAARTYVAERAKALDTTVEKLRELSEENPKLFAEVLSLKSSVGDSASISSLNGKNTLNMNTGKPAQIDGIPTKAYFDAKRKEMGTRAFMNDAKLQREYLDSAMKLKDRFNQ